jgi:hypothetical protein
MTKELTLDSWQEQNIFLFFQASGPALEQLKAYIQWLLVGSFSGVK